MKLTLIALIAAGTLVTGFVLLPSQKIVKREAVINAPADKIYTVLSSTEGFQTFNPYKDADENLKIIPFGPATGVGSGFSFEGKDGKGTQTIAQMNPNKSVTMNIDMGSMGQPVQTFHLEPTDAGTKVTWEVEMQFGKNPMMRVFGLFADKVMGSTYERGLANLNTIVAN